MNVTRPWTGLAVDLGASSGRVVAGYFNGEHLSVEEVHRFSNDPVRISSGLHWDILRLYHEVKEGIRKGGSQARTKGGQVLSVGIDSWAVDFGLLDRAGRLLGNPFHYRDQRTQGVMERVLQRIPKAELFRHSGIQFLPFNTLYQLAAMSEINDPQLAQADAFLMIPDLLTYFLTGIKSNEFTNATSTQLLEPGTQCWSTTLIRRLALPDKIFQPIVQPGTILGEFLPSVSEELGNFEASLVAVGTHDTASAVVGVPAVTDGFAYLSCGTWSLLGREVKSPVLSEAALEMNFTNEGGVCGTYRLLKNIAGLWLLQELKHEWERQGKRIDWSEMTQLTLKGRAFAAFINPDDQRFIAPGDMSGRIREFCRQTHQPEPQTDADLLRCVTESLVLTYRWVLERVDGLLKDKSPILHMVGGGIQNELLCQWTADACGRPVEAGPVEAAAIGNLAVQLLAAGEISSLSQARQLIRCSVRIQAYEPSHTDDWDQAYGRFCELRK